MDSRISNSSVAAYIEWMAGTARKLGDIERGGSFDGTTITCRWILLRVARHDQVVRHPASNDVRFEFDYPDTSEEHVQLIAGGLRSRRRREEDLLEGPYQAERYSVGKEKEGERAF